MIRGARGVPLAAVLMVQFVAAPASAQEQEITVSPAVKVSQSTFITRTYEGPTVAFDPRDPNVVYVGSADIQNNDCHIFKSTDGGRSFTELAGPDFGEYTDCGLNKFNELPQNQRMEIVVDADGVVYWAVAVAEDADRGGRSVMLARSSDGGETWTSALVTDAPEVEGIDDAVANFEPYVFVDPFGDAPRTVWVSWRRSFTSSSEKPTEGWAAVSTDGGETFGSEIQAIDANPGFDAPHLVMDDEGVTYWFQRAQPPSPEEGEDPRPSRLVMATSSDLGQTWEEKDLGVAEVVMEEPWVGVSPDGANLYVVWADGRSGTDVDIFFMRSADGGQTWSDEIRVNDDPEGNRKQQKWPRMEVAPNGRIDIVWYDYRNDANLTPEDDVEFFLGDLNDVYYAFSDDDGQTFSRNLRVNDLAIDRTKGTYNTQYFVEVPPGIGSSDDAAYVVWSDTRLGNQDNAAQDIFGTAVSFPTGGALLGLSTRSVVLAVELFLIGAGLALLIGTFLLRGRRRRPAPVT